jgi:hypothetical protein
MVVVRCGARFELHSWPRSRHKGGHYASGLGVHCVTAAWNLHRTLREYTRIRCLPTERVV